MAGKDDIEVEIAIQYNTVTREYFPLPLILILKRWNIYPASWLPLPNN